MDPILIAVGLLLVVAAVLGSKSKKKKATRSARIGWHIGPEIHGVNYSKGMPKQPSIVGNGWSFTFPSSPDKHVHYVQLFNPPSLLGKKEITIRFTVTGDGFVAQEYPANPALVSLLLQRKNDNWGAIGEMKSYRWFSSNPLTLAEGDFEMTVPLDAALWGDVYNGKDSSLFAATLQNLDNIAVIFGSDGGRGHGVYAKQDSTFTLKELVVK